MYRIRFHGRGGQGIRTAASVLGSALFASGREVQDAPRYGAERRGAPMSAHVRAGRSVIVERGAIAQPDLVVVADPTLLAGGVLQGLSAQSVLFLNGSEPADELRTRLACPGRVVTWPGAARELEETTGVAIGALCAGGAARLLGVISRTTLEQALLAEIAGHGSGAAEAGRALGLAGFDALADSAGMVGEGVDDPGAGDAPPDWVRLALDDASLAAPDVFREATSELVQTGLWRTSRPVIDAALCSRCSWVCTTLCPDSAIHAKAGEVPQIDYEHCKGCLVCVLACPPHAIRALPERQPATAGNPR
ncbi:2-oxoacid:acceptor oxidoreductase family protein [Accumulibacter sp.]|uniref:2-oxoacid:acceptor oxidoreductase family protein n=1 Tax=Accumulibacter sp. TaxID=2053492 RepID=UPI0025CBA4BB|nr:2-oxoacid:acceptor oxidoreductase family protein [Accumulibacter sp.]MCM8596693.1 2-oxoacid:acceptor oxidoreductase family protein [Accumulibacter sp.]MCM8624773.1 2-oxoacid:acceptor oxidoreductase family protein [Accumulibacter sp.]MDS4050841.1 2-oxoacid:acceptor oxidoreductase family protein [Accumulibacter sp.]